MKNTLLLILLVSLNSLSGYSQNFTQYVNPFIGTTNFGTTNPGAIVPQGMISVVPFNVTGSDENKWDKDAGWWSTPYSWDNHFFTGFSHVNLSGVGCPDLGVIMVMPTTGKVNANLREYGSNLSAQKAEPGYFSCLLNKYDVRAEVSATKRTGLSKF
ncbi:MAG: glycoside hydrolase family 92 protein, partial [Bacteroidota bacterium]